MTHDESTAPAGALAGAPPRGATRLQASDFHPEVLRLFDAYVHGSIDRRAFLDRTAKFAVGTTAAALLDALNPKFAAAQQVSKSDVRIYAESFDIPSPEGRLRQSPRSVQQCNLVLLSRASARRAVADVHFKPRAA